MKPFSLAPSLLLSLFSLPSSSHGFTSLPPTASIRLQISGKDSFSNDATVYSLHRRGTLQQFMNIYNENEREEEDDDDDDDEEDVIDADSLGDWRAFRRSLSTLDDKPQDDKDTRDEKPPQQVSPENQELLLSQNKELAEEYQKGIWAHATSTPEVGGLVVRMPLEVEIYRNHRHSLTGNRLRKKNKTISAEGQVEPAEYFSAAQSLVNDEMVQIAQMAGDDGHIDATILSEESAELLQLYLDNQETWQEVCLVLETSKGSKKGTSGAATTLVLNRPMAFKLTESLAQLVLYGTGRRTPLEDTVTDEPNTADLLMVKFFLAFGQECAVYVGGPDAQHKPAELIHGYAGLEGATEISPGTGIYRGGLNAAIDGVLRGDYRALDFRFFFGRHEYKESMLDVNVVLGKYQPVACARTLALKQCLSLPKPLWHEVLEVCGGDLADISSLEMLKRDDIQFEIADEDDEEDDDFTL